MGQDHRPESVKSLQTVCAAWVFPHVQPCFDAMSAMLDHGAYDVIITRACEGENRDLPRGKEIWLILLKSF